jgi:phytoene synthase
MAMIEHDASAYRFPNAATPPGSSAYYSIRFGAIERRPELALLFAWRSEMRRIARDTSDPGVARLKLDWWRGELEASHRGEGRHPLAQALGSPMAMYRLPLEPFLRQIDSLEQDLLHTRPADYLQLVEYCDAGGGSFGELLARTWGTPDDQSLRHARCLGSFVRLVEIVRELGLELRRQRCALPDDLLARHGLSRETLVAAPQPAVLAPALEELSGQAQALLPPRGAATAAPPRILAELHRVTLEEIRRAGFPVLGNRISLTPVRKLWIAWRASRQGRVSRPAS